ncbi:hypothetical protein [Butyricimonas paravirosa]|uniref:hypothetical protein n=1 Tax=Butyricimonas paravirosa TaxID=1472417 RepID=UPI00210B5F31|nr:hypothetical protein [Butyricimonas paravirosa]MCQ4874635.1 hypothetical protein [Butyricimonas paravirosa]
MQIFTTKKILTNRSTEFHIQSKEHIPIIEFYITAEVKEKYNMADSWIFVVAQKHYPEEEAFRRQMQRKKKK